MIRLGIVGTEMSHAVVVPRMLNFLHDITGEYIFPQCRVVCISGNDEERNKDVAFKGNVPEIIKTPENMIGKIDGVMIMNRHGDEHYKAALPFIEAGVPTWVDKPVTIKVEETESLIEKAEKNGTMLCGGSSIRSLGQIKGIKRRLFEAGEIGNVNTAILSYHTNFPNPYGGLFYYACHIIEPGMEIFGYYPKAVTARESKENILAVLEYEDYEIMFNFSCKIDNYYISVHGDDGVMFRQIDITDCYKDDLSQFLKSLEEGKSYVSYDELLNPVRVADAVVESVKSGKRIVF